MKILNLRLPYQGSKNKIALDLILEMKKYKPNAKYFIDLFGGGGSMSFTALQMGFKVLYNEFDTDLSNFVKYIFERIKGGERSKFGLFPEDWYKFVNRETFKQQLNEHTHYAEFCRICYSFSSNRKDYLFGKDKELIKELGHNIVVFQDEKCLKELNLLFKKEIILPIGQTINTRRLKFIRLQQLEQL